MAVYAFGSNKFGQLGIGSNEDALQPTIISSLKHVVHVASGESHSMALTQSGNLYCFGRGREGQLGNGETKDFNVPVLVQALKHERIIKAECGFTHSIALSQSGRVYIWGKLYKTNTKATTRQYFGLAIQMPGLETQELLDRSLQKYLQGQVNMSEQESNKMLNEFGNFIPVTQSTPMLMPELDGLDVIHVAAGYSYSAIVTKQGEVYTWGFNEKSQLGHGYFFNVQSPKRIEFFAENKIKIVKTACGQQHMLFLSDKGHLYTCGLGVFGQLGHNSLDDELIPRLVGSFYETKTKIVDIRCGTFYSMAVTAKGDVFSWGHGEYGQHGGSKNYEDWDQGGEENSKQKNRYHSVPRQMNGLDKINTTNIACGHLHTVVTTSNHEIFTFGWNSMGQLGHGDRRFQLIPKECVTLGGEKILASSAGGKHSMVIKGSSNSATFAFDFKPILNDAKYSDIVFEVGGKKIYAHKAIVFARCSHIRKMLMFHNRWANGDSVNNVKSFNMGSVRYAVFLGLLNYLYTDHLINVPRQWAIELEQLAKKYGLPRLVELCKRYRATFQDSSVIISASTFANEMGGLVDNDEYADICFSVQDQKIYAHRPIIIARCPYFGTLFASNFKETQQKTIEIDRSITVEIFLDVLKFIYTGDESIITGENAIDLLQAADKLILNDFKDTIEFFIEQSIEIENVANLLEVGDRFGAPKLKRSCLEFVTESSTTLNEFGRSQGFTELRSNPTLLRELDYHASKNHLSEPGDVFKLAQGKQVFFQATQA